MKGLVGQRPRGTEKQAKDMEQPISNVASRKRNATLEWTDVTDPGHRNAHPPLGTALRVRGADSISPSR
jgi:hypothetical protein